MLQITKKKGKHEIKKNKLSVRKKREKQNKERI